jgi:Domain of unknown function (DUF4340)
MNKSTIGALVIFAALAVAAVFTLRQPAEHGVTRISFAQVEPERVTRVVVEGSEKVELKKDGGTWQVDGKPADAVAVDRLLDAVDKIESSELTTRNKDRFAELEVDPEKGARVEVFAGPARAAEFVIGKSAQGGSYVLANDAVYLVRGVYRGTFARPRSGWLDRKVFSDGIDGVESVEVKLAGETPYGLVKKDDHWTLQDPSLLPAGQRFDEKAADELVRTLVNVQVTDLLNEDPGAEQTGLGDGADRVAFQPKGGGEPRALEIGKEKDATNVYAKASTRSDVATLSSSTARSLRKKVADLRDLRLMAFAPAAVKRLEIAGAEDRLVLEKQDNAWKVAESKEDLGDGFAVDPMLVARRISTLADLKATAEADGQAAEIGDPKSQVSLTLDDGRVVTLAFGGETKQDDHEVVLARGNADDRTYLVSKSDRDGVLRGADSFKKSAAAPGFGGLDPEALKNLPPDVQEAIRKQMAQEQQKQQLLEAIEKNKGKTGSE